MARSFASTDSVGAAAVSLANAAKGMCFWARLTTPTNNARFLHTSGITLFSLFYGTTNTRFEFQHFMGTTTGSWFINGANHGLTLTDWFYFALAWDGVIANSPVCYVAPEGASTTTSVTVTVNTPPAGTTNVDASTTVWMGNTNSGTSPLNGNLAYVSVFDRVPSKAEFDDALLASTSGNPGGAEAGRWALDSSNPATDLSGNGHNGTITGTSVVTDPTLYTPPADPSSSRPIMLAGRYRRRG